MKNIKIKYVRSVIGRKEDQKRTIEALGFKKLNQERVVKATPQIMGMVNKVIHLINVEEV